MSSSDSIGHWRARRLARALANEIPWRDGDSLLQIGPVTRELFGEAERRAALRSHIVAHRWDDAGEQQELARVLARAVAFGIEDRLTILPQTGIALPMRSGACTVAVSVGGFDHLPTARDRMDAGRELARVVSRGGTVVYASARYATDIARAFTAAGLRTDPPQRRWWSTTFRVAVVRATRP